MITARAFAGKHYAVYGLARSGLASAEALLASGARVTAWDDRLLPGEGRGPGQREPLLGSGLDPRRRRGTEIANRNEIDLSQLDSLVVKPGRPLSDDRQLAAVRARGYKSRLRAFVNNLEHAFAGGASGLHELIKLMQFPDRFIKKSGEHQKSDEITELHRAGQNGFCSNRDQEDDA